MNPFYVQRDVPFGASPVVGWRQAAVVCAALVGVVAPACTGETPAADVPAPTAWQVTPDVRIESLATGVWMHTSWADVGDARYFSNGLIVQDGQTITLIDTGWGMEPTEEILAWIDEEVGLPVTTAVITHFHDDKMSGTPALAQRRVDIRGLALTAELGHDQGVPLPTPLDGLDVGSGVAVGNVEVFYPGPAHTHDNIAVWVEHARILYGGCAIRPGGSTGMGNTADASLEGWADAMRRLQDRYPMAEVVIPSHGEPGGRDLLAHTIELAEAANASR